MRVKATLTAIILLVCLNMYAQEYTIDIASGSLEITDVNRVTLEGHEGSSIVVTHDNGDMPSDEENRNEDEDSGNDRAQGLKMINSKGQTDNTGLGLFISQEGNKAEITHISSSQGERYLIKVPEDVKVFYEHNTHNGNRLYIRNTRSEIEASVHYNSVHFENVQGPLLINAIYGKIEGTLENINHNISLHSTYGLVDLGIPASAPADIVIKTTYGRMYTDFDIDVTSSNDDNCSWCSKKMVGSVNNGGNEISLSSNYSSVYFRKLKG